MNMIGIIITIVLSALLLSVGTYYGDSMYKEQKVKTQAVKIKSDMEQISFAIKKAYSDDVFLDDGSTFQPLIKAGILSEVPYFNKDEAAETGHGSDYVMSYSFSNDAIDAPNMVTLQTRDVNLCKKINDEYSMTYKGIVPTIDETKQQQVPSTLTGALFNHLSVQFESISLFENKVDSTNKTFCYKIDDGKSGLFVVSHIVDMSKAYNDYMAAKNTSLQ